MTRVEMSPGGKNHKSTHQISWTFEFRYIPVCGSSIADTFLLECQQLHSLDRLFEACGIVQTLTKFLWRSSPVCRMSRGHVFTSFEAALQVWMLNRVCDWCINMSKGYLYSHTSVWSENAPTIYILVLELLTLYFGKCHVSELNILNNRPYMCNAPLTPVCFVNAPRKVVWGN